MTAWLNRKVQFQSPNLLFIFIILFVVIAVAQDYLFALLQGSAFYLSESLLFKIVWLLFLPLTYFLYQWSLKWQVGQIKSSTLIRKSLLWSVPVSLIHLFLFALLASAIAQLVLDLPFGVLRIAKYAFTRELYIIVFAYGLLFFVLQYWRREPVKEQDQDEARPQVLSVRVGKKIIPLPVQDIEWIGAEQSYSAIFTNGRKYLYNSSLKQLHDLLEPDTFVRIHRSTIVNVNQISELRSRQNGDYDVMMKNGGLLRLSRHYRAVLKSRLL